MPTYDLACRACGHRYERFLSRMLRADDRLCPVCGAEDMKTGVGGGFLGAGTGVKPSATASCESSRFS
jgi:putative FmdB family regulatory protein